MCWSIMLSTKTLISHTHTCWLTLVTSIMLTKTMVGHKLVCWRLWLFLFLTSNVCLLAFMHLRMLANVLAYTHVSVWVYIYKRMIACLRAGMQPCVCLSVCLAGCMCACTYVYVHACVCVCVYAWVHACLLGCMLACLDPWVLLPKNIDFGYPL